MDSAVRIAALAALRAVVDPEVGLDVVSMGLVYGVEVTETALVVRMTLTSAHCPLGEVLASMAREALAGVAGERRVTLELVFDPPWTPARISEEGRRQLQL
ncbi:MAG: metal-sulfur cluster assembly factor [Elusimicrobia bacterium]|nr:metal-sulfur cluster assembly factor [Elusimicrobiota bacterium]